MNAMRKIIIALFVLFPLISFAQGQITRPVKERQNTEANNTKAKESINSISSVKVSTDCVKKEFEGTYKSVLVPEYLVVNGCQSYEVNSHGVKWQILKNDGSIFKFATTSNFKGTPVEFIESMIFNDSAPAYNPHKKNWAVRSGYIDDCKYYTRAAKVGDKYYIFYYQFPKDDPINDDTFSEIVKKISLNFPVKD